MTTSNTPYTSSLKQAPGYDTQGLGKRTAVHYYDHAKNVVLNALKPLKYIGTPGTGWTATEYGDSTQRLTVLRATSSVAKFTIAANASEGHGQAIYTFPTKDLFIGPPAKYTIGITAASNPSDTPVLGLGTVVASGAISVLSGTATFQDISTGTALSGENGAFNTFGIDKTGVFKQANTTPTLFLNIAGAFSGADTLTIKPGSTIMFRWYPMDITEEQAVSTD